MRYRIILIVNAGLALALVTAWCQLAARSSFWAADFTGLYTGWAMVLDGQGSRLYDLDLQNVYQQHHAPELAATGTRLLFNYPPHLAVPAAAFALLPREAAFHAWTLFQLLLLVPLVLYVRQLLPEKSAHSLLLAFVTLAAFPPLFVSFQLGQVSILILVCLLGFVRAVEDDKPLPTAIWFVLLTLKPQFLLAPTAILLAGRRWRALGLATVLFAAWGLLASLVLGWSCWGNCYAVLRHLAWQFGSDGVHPLAMYNLKGFLAALLGDDHARFINLLSAASVVVAFLALLRTWSRRIPAHPARWDARMALSLLLALLVNPHFNPADAVTLLVPALLLYRGTWRANGPVSLVAAALTLAPLLFALDCYGLSIARPSAAHPFFLFGAAFTLVTMRFHCGIREKKAEMQIA